MNRREALKKTVVVMGYTIAIPALIDILGGCNSHPGQSWQPQFFSTDQASLMSELTETILPKTQTPGAKDLHIDQFIDRIIKQVFSPADQQLFTKGMEAFEAESREVNGKGFIESSPEERGKLLTKLEQEAAKETGSIWGFSLEKDPNPMTFYRKAKELTLLGYFTSKEIGKDILVYDPVPGKFVADMPLGHRHISFE